MVRTLLVDDEVTSIRVLKNLLSAHCPEVEIVGEADSVQSAIKIISSCSPDLVLLDIAINNETAFDLLSSLNEIIFQIIFVTASDNHAVQAFKFCAVDYLLKPVDATDLQRAIKKVTKRSHEKEILENLKALQENIQALKVTDQKMAVPTMNGLSFVVMKDIMHLEASGSCTKIYLSNGEQLITTRIIKEYEDLLPANIFYRVHNAHIINLNRIQNYQKGRGGTVHMEDGTAIEVAFRRREDFLKRLLK
ncbi:LytR/AlgR family response regulator transcription factor [Niastella sp. OAS944]|uniref:LytR/AlgR family response regulator transcription factor n=1 Tax=Niastella sp. OAS944 TaxID=2664089 RepID=UPI00349400ED|nr:two-component system LytT family response regulator [Chitinophagaceae bacterium OAS944]